MPDMTEEPTDTEPLVIPNRQTPFSEPFKAFIPQGWAPYPDELPAELPAAASAALRRRTLAETFPGERLVIPAGGLKPRASEKTNFVCAFPEKSVLSRANEL